MKIFQNWKFKRNITATMEVQIFSMIFKINAIGNFFALYSSLMNNNNDHFMCNKLIVFYKSQYFGSVWKKITITVIYNKGEKRKNNSREGNKKERKKNWWRLISKDKKINENKSITKVLCHSMYSHSESWCWLASHFSLSKNYISFIPYELH